MGDTRRAVLICSLSEVLKGHDDDRGSCPPSRVVRTCHNVMLTKYQGTSSATRLHPARRLSPGSTSQLSSYAVPPLWLTSSMDPGRYGLPCWFPAMGGAKVIPGEAVISIVQEDILSRISLGSTYPAIACIFQISDLDHQCFVDRWRAALRSTVPPADPKTPGGPARRRKYRRASAWDAV